MSFRAREENLGHGNNGLVGLSIGTLAAEGGKVGPSRPPETHTPRYRGWRSDG